MNLLPQFTVRGDVASRARTLTGTTVVLVIAQFPDGITGHTIHRSPAGPSVSVTLSNYYRDAYTVCRRLQSSPLAVLAAMQDPEGILPGLERLARQFEQEIIDNTQPRDEN